TPRDALPDGEDGGSEAYSYSSSARLPGEGGLDFQEEVGRVPKAIGHAFDHLDAVVHPLQDTGVQGEARTGEDAPGVFAQVAGKALQWREAAVPGMPQPGSPAPPALPHAGGIPDFLQGILEHIDRGQWLVGVEEFL